MTFFFLLFILFYKCNMYSLGMTLEIWLEKCDYDGRNNIIRAHHHHQQQYVQGLKDLL